MSLHSELQSMNSEKLVSAAHAVTSKLVAPEGTEMIVDATMEDVPAFDKLGKYLMQVLCEDFPPEMAHMAALGAGLAFAAIREFAVTQEMEARFPGLSNE